MYLLFSFSYLEQGRLWKNERKEKNVVFYSYATITLETVGVTFDYVLTCSRLIMSDEKSRKPLKLKTLDEIKNDTVYEINLFSKKRRSGFSKSSVVTTANDEDDVDDQVRWTFSFRNRNRFYF
jgi:hypothetical protein